MFDVNLHRCLSVCDLPEGMHVSDRVGIFFNATAYAPESNTDLGWLLEPVRDAVHDRSRFLG